MNSDDAIAGSFLLIFGSVGIILYVTITHSMLKMCHEIVGFRFLISQAISDILLMLQFGVWPGILILCKRDLLPESSRWYLHVYLDFTWWSMVYHYTIVAWSRLAAVQWPNWFRTLPNGTCIMICAAAWFLGLVQSLVEHQFPWFVHLYYNPDRYGLDADWREYERGGTAGYYMVFNLLLMVLPFPFYAAALCVLFRRQRKRFVDIKSRAARNTNLSPTAFAAQRQLSIETRLLIPCIINTILFVIGQIFITVCSKHGKWMNWAVLVVFLANCVANPILYLFFSSVIRKHVFFGCKNRMSLSAVYHDYECRSSQVSNQRQSLLRGKRDATVSSELNKSLPKTSVQSM